MLSDLNLGAWYQLYTYIYRTSIQKVFTTTQWTQGGIRRVVGPHKFTERVRTCGPEGAARSRESGTNERCTIVSDYCGPVRIYFPFTTDYRNETGSTTTLWTDLLWLSSRSGGNTIPLSEVERFSSLISLLSSGEDSRLDRGRTSPLYGGDDWRKKPILIGKRRSNSDSSIVIFSNEYENSKSRDPFKNEWVSVFLGRDSR